MPFVGYDSQFRLVAPTTLQPDPPVYHFRPFRNTDPPRIADIWRSQPPQRGLMQPVTAALLEPLVFAKPYFDPAGLIVALADNEPIGFAHAGFGPREDEAELATDSGTTYQLMLRSDHREHLLADELLARSEAYLRECGAQVVYAGGIRPLNGFYLGLYGGSELPGVLLSDPVFGAACLRSGYREIDRVQVLQLELSQYRPPVTRELRQLRRDTACSEEYCPPLSTWWDACTTGAFERIRFSLCKSSGGPPLADVWFWDIEPLSTCWGLPTAGMFDLHVHQDVRRSGLATHLLSEAMGRLRNRGIKLAEAQTMQHNTPALELYRKLGFTKVDEGVVYRKE
jgi:GNAT superfamily N-acetyltransferase